MAVSWCCLMRQHPDSLYGQLANRTGQCCPVRFEYRRMIVFAKCAHIRHGAAPVQTGRGVTHKMEITMLAFVWIGSAWNGSRISHRESLRYTVARRRFDARLLKPPVRNSSQHQARRLTTQLPPQRMHQVANSPAAEVQQIDHRVVNEARRPDPDVPSGPWQPPRAAMPVPQRE